MFSNKNIMYQNTSENINSNLNKISLSNEWFNRIMLNNYL